MSRRFALCAVLFLALTACSGGTSTSRRSFTPLPAYRSALPAPPQETAPTQKPQPSFPTYRASFWQQNVRGAPLAADSTAIVTNLALQVSSRYGGVAAFNDESYDMTNFIATASTPLTTVKWIDCQGKGATPPQLYSSPAWFVDVPIPSEAKPAVGTDAEMTIYRPETDQLWEFWVAGHGPDGWHACWGGRLDHASDSPGYFSDGGGATATGLIGTAGEVTTGEAAAGVIDHAIDLEVVDARSGTFSWPAQRGDGNDPSTDVVAEGQRLRLDPAVDVDALGLSPVAAAIARAAQTYGFVVMDRSGAVAVEAQNGSTSGASGGTDPWGDILRQPGYSVLANFPWDKLQALPVDLGKPPA